MTTLVTTAEEEKSGNCFDLNGFSVRRCQSAAVHENGVLRRLHCPDPLKYLSGNLSSMTTERLLTVAALIQRAI